MSASISPLLPSRGATSGVNVAQASLSEDFMAASPKYFTKYMRPSGIDSNKLSVSSNFNMWSVVMAALIFIIILSWFELMRLIIQSFFIEGSLIINQMIAYFVYAVVGTIIAALLLYICYHINK